MPNLGPSPVATQAARALFTIFDQSKTDHSLLDGDDTSRDVTHPPDGVLDRGELPSRHFDQLALSGGRIDPAALAAAIAKLAPTEQQAVLDDANATIGGLKHTGSRFLGGFAGFAGGGAALMGGLLLGGGAGLGLAVLGAVGLLVGIGIAVGAIFKGGSTAKQLLQRLDAHLDR